MAKIIAPLVGFALTFINNMLMAVLIITPFLDHRLEVTVKDPSLLNMPALIAGYLLMNIVMAFVYPRVMLGGASWLRKSVILGSLFGVATFVSVHLVLVGYTTIDPMAFILSGILDAIGPLVGMIGIGFVYRKSAPMQNTFANNAGM